ncbi:hypothetical protein GCM10010412_028680 [Nonomuraea recticatena]|uniref:Uncharacterized protein n=1 Tax=Nonomuraea recticatena TaxID=46178 RepID=A0ABN3RPX6_9ACTN
MPGADRRNVRQALNYVWTEAVNARTTTTSEPDELCLKYLSWAVEAATHLRSQVSSRDIDRLVLTRRYWALQRVISTAPHLHGKQAVHIAQLVRMELEERAADLKRAIDNFEDRVQRWSNLAVYVVADTSFYIRPRRRRMLAGVRGSDGAARRRRRACLRRHLHARPAAGRGGDARLLHLRVRVAERLQRRRLLPPARAGDHRHPVGRERGLRRPDDVPGGGPDRDHRSRPVARRRQPVPAAAAFPRPVAGPAAPAEDVVAVNIDRTAYGLAEELLA